MREWVKPGLTLLVLFVLILLLPNRGLDPWGIFNPRKMATMIFALTLIQTSGSLILQLLGFRVGAILTGFLGGLVSSTATTASLAKRSKHQISATSSTLIFLAATVAMLFEGIAVVLFGTKDVHAAILIVFLGPSVAAGVMIFLNAEKTSTKTQMTEDAGFDLLPLFKLSAFIIGILSISKLLQKFLGKSGLLILTFLVSLFEIHGSLIANIQLHDSGAFDVQMLGNLATLSVAASLLSKLFLIFTLGSSDLKVQSKKYTWYLVLSLILSWLVFSWLV